MNVLVTGARGFLGRAVVNAYLADGHRVRALVRPMARTDDLWAGQVEVVEADLVTSSVDTLDSAFDGVEALVHLAAAVTGEEAEQFASTVVGTERLLDAMSRSACRRVLLASSFTVYDWAAANGTLSEDTPLATDFEARGAYTWAKAWQERVAQRLSDEHDFSLTVLRPGIIWGPGRECPSGITAQFGSVHLVFGVGASLPLVFVENCAQCFVAVTEHPETGGQILNVVDPERIATVRFVREHLRRSGEPGMAVVIPFRLGLVAARAAGAANQLLFRGKGRLPSFLVPERFIARFKPLSFSTAKLERTIGWRPPCDLRTALGRTFHRGSGR